MQQPETCCPPLAFCGERACPALGGKAAPVASQRCARYTVVADFGAAVAAQRGTSPLATTGSRNWLHNSTISPLT